MKQLSDGTGEQCGLTSKTGLKLDQKLLLIPSPERSGYRKSYLAGRLNVDDWP